MAIKLIFNKNVSFYHMPFYRSLPYLIHSQSAGHIWTAVYSIFPTFIYLFIYWHRFFWCQIITIVQFASFCFFFLLLSQFLKISPIVPVLILFSNDLSNDTIISMIFLVFIKLGSALTTRSTDWFCHLTTMSTAQPLWSFVLVTTIWSEKLQNDPLILPNYPYNFIWNWIGSVYGHHLNRALWLVGGSLTREKVYQKKIQIPATFKLAKIGLKVLSVLSKKRAHVLTV